MAQCNIGLFAGPPVLLAIVAPLIGLPFRYAALDKVLLTTSVTPRVQESDNLSDLTLP